MYIEFGKKSRISQVLPSILRCKIQQCQGRPVEKKQSNGKDMCGDISDPPPFTDFFEFLIRFDKMHNSIRTLLKVGAFGPDHNFDIHSRTHSHL